MLLSFVANTSMNYHHSCEFKEEQTTATALACNIYHEARGESMAGQLAVGHVTQNRADVKRFDDNIIDVVYARKQFSWTHDGKTDNVYNLNDWVAALKYSSIILSRASIDFTEGSLFYHLYDIKPYWVDVKAFIMQIDNHMFYDNDLKKQINKDNK